MSANREDPAKRSGKADVRTNPAINQPVTSTSFHGRSTFGQNIPHDSDNSSDFDVWVAPDCSDVNPEQVAIPRVKSAASVFPTAWKDCHVSIKRKADMKILEQCSCKESDLPPVKMQYLLNFHFKELETALCDELFKLKWTVTCVKPGDQCLSIEVKHYTDESVLEDVILLFSDEVNKVNYCHSMQASKHPELLLKEYIDSGNLAIYVDGEKVCIVGIVENQRKVTETLRKKTTSADYSSTAAYKSDIQFDNSFKFQLLIYLQFLPSLKQKHPSVNVTMNEEKKIMFFCGENRVDVQAAVDEVHLFTKDLAVEDITLDPLLTKLLKLPDIETFIKKLCEEQDLKVIWTLTEFNNSITCYCKDKKAVQDFSDVLQHNLEKKTYSKRSFGDKTRIFSTTNMFSNFVKKYDGKCLVLTVEGNSVHIFTTRDIGNELALLEVTFKGIKIDIQKNLTQDEKKIIHDQTSATTKKDTTEERTEVGMSVVKVPMPHQELLVRKDENFMNVTIRHDSEKEKQDTNTKKWVRVQKQKGTKSIRNTEAQSVGDRTVRLQGAWMPPKENRDTYPQGAWMPPKDNHDTHPQGALMPPKENHDTYMYPQGARPKEMSDGAKKNTIVSAWSVAVQLRICVKTKDGRKKTEKISIEKMNIPALQFLIQESSSLKEKIRTSVDRSFTLEPPKVKTDCIGLKFCLKAVSNEEGISMIEKTVVFLTKLMNSIHIVDISPNKQDFNSLLTTVEHEILPEWSKEVHIYNQNDEKLIIVGHKLQVEGVHAKLMAMFQSRTQSPDLVEKTTVKRYPLDAFDIMLFEKLGVKERLQVNQPEVKIRVNQNELEISGPPKLVSSCVQKIQKWQSMKTSVEKHLEKQYLDLLSISETRAHVKDFIHKQGICCVYKVDIEINKLKVFANSKKAAGVAVDIILECIESNDFKTRFVAPDSNDQYKDKTSVKAMKGENEERGLKDMNNVEVQNFESKSMSTRGEACYILKRDFDFLLRDKMFRKLFEEKCPYACIEETDGKLYILFKDAPAARDGHQKLVDKFYNNIPSKTESIEHEIHYLLLTKQRVQEFVNQQLQKSNLHCYWELMSEESSVRLQVKGSSKDIVKRGLHVINKSSQIRRIHVMVTPEIQKRVKQVEDDFYERGIIYGNELKSESLDVVASSNVFDIFYKQVDLASIPYSCDFTIRWENVEYLKEYMRNEIKDLETKFDVNILLHNYKRVVVQERSFNREYVEECVQELKKICNYQLSTDCILFQTQESTSKFRSIDGKRYLKQIESDHSCLLYSKIAEPQQVCTLSILDYDFHVVIVHGRTLDLPVDVGVCPVTECLFPFGYSAEVLKESEDLSNTVRSNAMSWSAEKKLKIGDVKPYVPGSSFPCQAILLSVMFIQHQPVNLDDIQTAIMKALDYCEKEKVQSVAIPVQVHETRDVESQTIAVIKALEKVFLKSRNSSIQEIYVCVVDKDELDDVVKLFTRHFAKSFDKWDWRPIYPQGDNSRKGISSIKSHLVIGSLVDQKVDIIVNTTGTKLNLKEGVVSQSILQKAGSEIQAACNKKAPINVGSVVVTPSGNLQHLTGCQYICHGVLPGWYHRTGLSLKVLKLVMWQCMQVADKENCSSIAFPAFGTGKLKYPPYEVAKVMFETVDMYGKLTPSTQITDVRILVYFEDERNREIFRSVEKQRHIRGPYSKEGDSESDVMLQCSIPSGSGNITLQVLPLKPNVELEGQFLVKFDDKNVKNPHGCDFCEDKDGTLIVNYKPLFGFDRAVIDGFMKAEEFRITTVTFVMSKSKEATKEIRLDAKIKIIRDAILKEKEAPYLQLVKIYVEDKAQYTQMLNNPNKEEEKTGMLGNLMNSVSDGFFKKKTPTIWKTMHSSKQEEPMIVTITGKQKYVHDVKEKVKKHFNSPQMSDHSRGLQAMSQTCQQRQWYRVSRTSKTKTPLPHNVCRRLEFAVAKKDEYNVEMVTEDEVWVYKIKDLKCYSNSNKDVKYGLENYGTCVDDAFQKHNKRNEEMFTLVTAEISSHILSTKQWQDVEDVLKTLSITPIKNRNSGNMEISCKSLEELGTVNKELEEKFNVDTSFVLLNKQATQGKSMIDRTKKTQKTTPTGDVQRIAAFDLSPLEYIMLKFYCGDCRLFVGKYEYTGGKLLRTLVSGEGEDDLKFVLKEKMDHLRTLSSIELQYSPGIEDEKLHEIERSLSSSEEILCYRVDSKNLTFYGFSYEKLGMAKHKSEVLLGLKQQSKGRRNIVITTDQTLEKDDDKSRGAPKYQSFHDGGRSMSYKGSSATVLEQTYKTTEGIIVKVYNGSIFNLKVECIVNAANSKLSHGSGMAEVISRVAGYRFQQESDDYIQQYGSLDVGTCCSTSAGYLIYKNVIHTVGPNWHKYTDKNLCCSDLKMAVECCFYEAEVCNVSSIAIPSISAGIFGVPVSVCTQQYALAVEEFSRKNGNVTCLREIHFIDKDLGLVSAIQNVFSQKFNMVSSGPANTVPSDQPTGKSVKRESGYMRSKSEDHASMHQDKPPDITPSVKFPKQYKTAKGIKLFIIEDNITKLSVDAIVCPQDEDLRSFGAIAKLIEKTCDEEYKRVVCKMSRISMTEVKKCKATPKGLPFRYVVHAVAPRWDKSAVHDQQKFMKDLELTIRNIIRHASDTKEIKTVALPVLGIGTIQEMPYDIFVMLTAKIVHQESQKENFKLSEIYIVTNDNKVAIRLVGLFDKEQAFSPLTSFSRTRRNITAEKKGNGSFNQQTFGEENLRKSTKADKLGMTVKHGDLDDCVICMEPPTFPRKLHCGHIFCDTCIVKQFKVKPVCPTCGSIQGVVTGDQPPGTMKVKTSGLSLSGHHHCGRIEIEYVIYPGKQTAEHPNEGQLYEGITRIAYLPDNEKGKKIAKLLRVAFDRKLIFTIGHSRTTGKQGVVTWNDIHHKTNPNPGKQFGYPDDTYLDRVLDELRIKGVTEKDL